MGQTFNEADHPRGPDGRFVPKLGTVLWNVLFVIVAIYIFIHFRAGSRVGADKPNAAVATEAPSAASASTLSGAVEPTEVSPEPIRGVVVDRRTDAGRFLVGVRVAAGDAVTVAVPAAEWEQCPVGAEFDTASQPICIMVK